MKLDLKKLKLRKVNEQLQNIDRKINDYEIVSLLSFLFRNGEKYE